MSSRTAPISTGTRGQPEKALLPKVGNNLTTGLSEKGGLTGADTRATGWKVPLLFMAGFVLLVSSGFALRQALAAAEAAIAPDLAAIAALWTIT